MAKLTKEEREALGGSVYDQMYFTDDELQRAAAAREAARSGQSDWGSAHDLVEGMRSGYGYSGGAKGNQYIQNDGYVYTQPKPEYVSRYEPYISEGVEKLLSREPFSYDPTTDPRYAAYKKEYAREGQRAAADVMGQYAAMTGGMPSTAAVTASQQAGDYYAAQMADKIPELYNLAYQMYLGEGDQMRSDLNLLRGLEGDEYGRYADALGQWNTDRSFGYGVYSDDLERAHRAERESVEDARYEQEAALQRALSAAQYGDYSGLQALGINPDTANVLRMALAAGGRTSPIGSGSGGGGGGGSRRSGGGSSAGESGDVWSDVEAWVSRYGEDAAADYIKEHYKDMGFSSWSAALAGWNNHLLEKGDRQAYLSDLYNSSLMNTALYRGVEGDLWPLANVRNSGLINDEEYLAANAGLGDVYRSQNMAPEQMIAQVYEANGKADAVQAVYEYHDEGVLSDSDFVRLLTQYSRAN